jgi:hypothetical protein
LVDGNGDYLQTTLNLDGPFTFECWARPANISGEKYIFRMHNSGDGFSYVLGIINTAMYIFSGGTTSGGTLAANTWYHLAYVRSSSDVVTLYLNGTSVGSRTVTTDLTNAIIYIGGYTNALGMNGHLDEIRISNIERYTSTFTAPTAPFVNDSNTLLLIHADGTDASTVFRDDNGALAGTSTGTAVTFDGTGDYYSATGITTSATDSKYLLLVCTFYWAGGNNLQHIADMRLGTGGGDVGFYSWINGGRSQITLVGGGSEFKTMYENAENSLTTNAWNQIVFYMQTDSTANSRIYINGVSRAFTNSNESLTTLNWGNTATTITIGQKQAAITGTGTDFNGRIAQVYISNPATFPGIEAFWSTGPRDLGTNGTATGLAQPLVYHYGNNDTFRTNNGTGFASYTLTANGNAGTASTNLPIYYSPRTQKGIQAIGNAQISTAQSQFGGGSWLGDGTGDYLQIANSSDFNFGSGNFTIEGWLRYSTTPNFIGLMRLATLGGVDGWNIQWDSSSRIYLEFRNSAGTGASVIVNTQAISANTWTHFAFTRSGNTVYAFRNGNLDASATVTWQINPSTAPLVIGSGYGISTTWGLAGEFNGHLDEIRLSNTARYTANFTPSTQPFQNDANTVLLIHADGTNGSTVFTDDNGIAPYTL